MLKERIRVLVKGSSCNDSVSQMTEPVQSEVAILQFQAIRLSTLEKEPCLSTFCWQSRIALLVRDQPQSHDVQEPGEAPSPLTLE